MVDLSWKNASFVAHLVRAGFCLATILAIVVVCGPVATAREPDAPLKVNGRVIDSQGNVLGGVLVRVTVPGANLRASELDADRRVIEAKTDDQGRYAIETSLRGESSLTVEAAKPGVRSTARTIRLGEERSSGLVGEEYNTHVKPGEIIHASFVMHPALYVAGTVVDEAGQAISGVDIYSSVGTTKTDGQGHFEIFNFPLRREPWRGGGVSLEHPQFVNADLKDVYAQEAKKLASLRIVLQAGRKISGRVVDASGKPVAGALVEARYDDDWSAKRSALTAADGHFAFGGLFPAPARLLVQALGIKQHLQMPLALDRDQADLELRLEPIVLEEPADALELFGMKLGTITPAVRAAYFLNPSAQGAVVLDPGDHYARLGIGELHEGDYFMLSFDGRRRIRTLLDFVNHLRAEIARTKDAPPYRVYVDHVVNHIERRGGNLPYLRLTADDARQLDAAADELARRPPVDAGPKQGLLGLSPEDSVKPGLAGVRIASIQPDTAAARAGLVVGEIIVKVDDVEIHTSAELVKAIRSRKPGDEVVLRLVDREMGSPHEVAVTLGEY